MTLATLQSCDNSRETFERQNHCAYAHASSCDFQHGAQPCHHCAEYLTAKGESPCEKENIVAWACITIFRECHRSRAPCGLTHPLLSFFISTPEIGALKRFGSTAMTFADCCQYGSAWGKSTFFLSCHFMKASCIEFSTDVVDVHCSRSQRPHIKLCDGGPRKQRWSHVAQHFPPRLNRALAFLLLPKARAGGSCWRSPSHG